MTQSTADQLLDSLAAHGVTLFIGAGAGAGTDFPPIIEAFAKRQTKGEDQLRPLTIVHEGTAVALAHGYAMVSGETPCVMMHTTVGTANGLCGIINAAKANVPLFIWAGRTPLSESGYPGSRRLAIHWAQESFDQAAMLREYVKWDYELKQESAAGELVSRGLAIAESQPQGPVYLGLPLEVLEKQEEEQARTAIRQSPRSDVRASQQDIDTVLKLLKEATKPLIITSALGKNKNAVTLLELLSERLAIPVVEHWPTHMNMRRDFDLHLGFDPHLYIDDADLILVIESAVPWYPKHVSLDHTVKVINIGHDALFERYPMRGFEATLNISADPGLILDDLLLNLSSMDNDYFARRRGIDNWRKALEKSRSAEIDSQSKPISKAWISRCIEEQREDDDIVITEYVLDQNQMGFTLPGTFFNHSPAGGLGWGMGAALGAKLASPDSTVICCIGDGAYTFSAPVSSHHASAMHNLPVLIIVFNNGTLNTTRQTVLGSYPEGAASKLDKIPFCDLDSVPRYEEVCKAAGGYGECVTEPEDLPDAIRRALREVKEEGRQALLNVVCDNSSIV